MEEWVETLLVGLGAGESFAIFLRLVIFILVLFLISLATFWITRQVIIHYLYRFFKRSTWKWDDLLADNKVFNNLAHIVPAIFVRIMAPVVFSDFQQALPFVIKLTDSYLIIVGLTIVTAFLKVIQLGFSSHPAFKDKPLASYFQLVRIVLYIIVFILVLSVMLERSPIYFLSAFGAMTAIILLIFKDTILGLVASVQISANDMVKVGDWVEMPKFNADGDVLDINLNTVKVQNWDKTITTIPTYFFVTDSFRNWRGMVQSGGRRIKRSLFIDVHSVRFVDPAKREELKKIYLIKEYVSARQQEIEAHNMQFDFDPSVLVNGRRMTNLGVFRMYVESYLRRHPRIRQDMIIMVRQLATESKGIPMEVYCFTDTTAWIDYESIQADVFDHLFATAVFFDLDVFQEPSGKDISRLALSGTSVPGLVSHQQTGAAGGQEQ